MNSLRILIIISLVADNNKDFLTLTSIYIQHLLQFKSFKKKKELKFKSFKKNSEHDNESLIFKIVASQLYIQ